MQLVNFAALVLLGLREEYSKAVQDACTGVQQSSEHICKHIGCIFEGLFLHLLLEVEFICRAQISGWRVWLQFVAYGTERLIEVKHGLQVVLQRE